MGKKGKRADGEGTFRLRADGRWEYRVMAGYKPDGSPQLRSFYGKTQTEAKNKFASFQAQRHAGIILMAQTPRLGELAEQWLEFKRQRDAISENTYQQYKYGLNKFRVLYKQRLDKLTPRHIDQIYTQMLQDGLSPRSVQVAHRSLYGALKQAVVWEMIGRNILDSVKVPKQIKPNVPFWTAEEVTHFLMFARPHRLYGLFYTAIVTGMRRGELVALRWRDVDIVKERLSVRLSAVDVRGIVHVGEPKTKASRRTIYLQGDDIRVLIEHRKRQQGERLLLGEAWSDHDLVFPSQLGTHLNPRNLSRLFEQLGKAAGVSKIGMHGLRHTHASLLIKNGVDVGVVSERLGHTSPGLTRNVYQHLYDEQRSQAALGLANLLQGAFQQKAPDQLSVPN